MDIRQATEEDARFITLVVTEAFDEADEAEIIFDLREEGAMVSEYVAVKDGEIIGHLAMSAFIAPKGWLVLGPVAVMPLEQGQGVGSAMIRQALANATGPVVVLGNPEYYNRFGLDVQMAANLKTPYPNEYTGVYVQKGTEISGAESLQYPVAFEDDV